MSFTTRCPACGTTFKVVPDQLKISDGWVRCGHCADVFDATLHLQADASTALVPAPVPLPPPAPKQTPKQASPKPVRAPAVSATEHDDEGDWLLAPRPRAPAPDPLEAWSTPEFLALGSPSATEAASPRAERRGQASTDPWATPPAPRRKVAAEQTDRFSEELKQFAKGGDADVSVAPTRRVSGLVPLESAPARATEVVPAVAEPSAGATVPGFVRQAQRKAFWRSPIVRAVLVVVSVLLGVLLVLQWAIHERDRLAAQHPSSVPLLASLCKTLGCRLGPVRQIDAVVIDSSNLVRRQGNSYSFDLVLKSSASMPVAVPALELSLTDTRDAVISRRVFLPDELPGAPVLLPAQGSLSMSLRMSIADSSVSAMTGYRALVFYP